MIKRMYLVFFVALLSTAFNHSAFAVEVEWVPMSTSPHRYGGNSSFGVYLDFNKMCEVGAALVSEYNNNDLNCRSINDKPACFTFRFYKTSNHSSKNAADKGCWIINDLGVIDYALAMKRRIKCTPDDSWNSGFTAFTAEEYASTYCQEKLPKDASQSCPATKEPIAIGYGNKFLNIIDYQYTANIRLQYRRTYNSIYAKLNTRQGKSWANSNTVSLNVIGNQVFAFRPDGKIIKFLQSGTDWNPDADVKDQLTQLFDANNVAIGWQYLSADNTTDIFDVDGKRTSSTDKAGNTITYTLSTAATPTTIAFNENLPITHTDHIGRSLNFIYDGFDRLTTMTNPQGGVYTYTYDANNNLATVTYPDSTVKTYHYGETAHVSATPDAGVDYTYSLTGITDENGDRYATYRYDAQGRAYDEELAPDLGVSSGQTIEHNNLVYNVDANGNPTSTVVTDPRGSVRTYNFTTILGVVKSTGSDQPAGAGCAASASALTYDVNGNIASRTDFNGNQTAYSYDMARNLETSRTEGLTTAGAATPESRTITSTWHATWRLPLTISEYAGAAATGTALKTTTYVYDSKGNITSLSIADPINNKTRTTTTAYTYSAAVPGLMLTRVVDGPRTDVSDISTYNYYPHDATCTASTATPIIDPITNVAPANLGCRGQLASMSNALNQTTTYDRYNHHGQVEQMTDPNGLVTTSTYDLRQRITNRTVGTEVTNFQYDNVGQLTQLTLPDSSTLAYSYDAAHRLTDIEDNLGNKVHYTLDTQGNRTQEDITDPQGSLTKTLSRSYDALNRLEQLTGVE